MNAATVLSTRNAVKFECGVTCGIHGMIPNASLAIQFRMDDPTGLCVGFHGTTEEMRQFAAELIRHCDAADEAERQQVAA